MKENLVSIIIPVFNRPRELREAVSSALAQTYDETEILIVDDGSTDETAAVARELAAGISRVLLITQMNGGPGAAREAGRQAAKGEYLQYLDSDDLLLPDKLALQVERLRQSPKAVLTYGASRHVRGGTSIHCDWKPNGVKIDRIFPATLNERYWDTPSPLYRAEPAALAGPWSNLRVEEDWEYDCRIGIAGQPVDCLEREVVIVRHDSDTRISMHGHSPAQLQERAAAQALIFEHAVAAGVQIDSPEMQKFARSLFLLARQCGSSSLTVKSAELLRLALSIARGRLASQIAFYMRIGQVTGLAFTGKASGFVDRLRAARRRESESSQ